MTTSLAWIDYTIMATYVIAVLGIGFALKHAMKTSNDFFLSGRSIPAWITGLAFLSANLGALELVGMAASGAKYGIATAHFYWVGAIPAMIFLAVFMMPFYYGSKARSVPEYLKLRFDERTRCLNSISFAAMTLFASGISMDALAKLLHQLLGWDYNISLFICSGVVLVYVLKGGLTSAIYTEVLQFFMIVLGFAPVVYLGLKDVGGGPTVPIAACWTKLTGTLADVSQAPAKIGLHVGANQHFSSDAWTSAWKPLLAGSHSNPMGVDVFAMVFGLGFVLSFGYWCTNFLVVQRAMAARNMSAARRTPLIAAVPKMLFPVLVILPGMLAVALAWTGKDNYHLPKKILDRAYYSQLLPAIKAAGTIKPAKELEPDVALKLVKTAMHDEKAANELDFQGKALAALIYENADKPLPDDKLEARLQDAVGTRDYGLVILSLVTKYCPPGMLGLALTALLASFMSGMAGNVTAFNTVWTYDIYQAYLAPNRSDAHYMWMGRVVTVVGVLLSIACAYFAKRYDNAMDSIQLVFGFVNAPLFATFLLGMFWAGTTASGAFLGLLGGIVSSALFHGLTVAEGKGGWLVSKALYEFPSTMAQNFWLASVAFTTCLVLTVAISIATRRTKSDEELKGLVYSLTPKIKDDQQAWIMRPGVLGVILLIGCVILNYIFW